MQRPPVKLEHFVWVSEGTSDLFGAHAMLSMLQVHNTALQESEELSVYLLSNTI